MSDIQRWTLGIPTPWFPDDGGGWVAYADHVAAVAEAEQRYESDLDYTTRTSFALGYEQGQKDERKAQYDALSDNFIKEFKRQVLAKAVAAVEALEPSTWPSIPAPEYVQRSQVIAAIKGVGE